MAAAPSARFEALTANAGVSIEFPSKMRVNATSESKRVRRIGPGESRRTAIERDTGLSKLRLHCPRVPQPLSTPSRSVLGSYRPACLATKLPQQCARLRVRGVEFEGPRRIKA